MHDPVFPMDLAIYGHPESGNNWEEFCNSRVTGIGWKKMGWELHSVYYHEKYKAVLIIYVDDFRVAAPEEHHEQIWKELREVLELEPESEDGRLLGCDHISFEATTDELEDLLQTHPQYHPRL